MPIPQTHADRRSMRWGLVLFFVYLLFYAGFVYLNAFRSDVMAKPSLGGINLATMYGLALIVVALVLALIYMLLCKNSGNNTSEDAR
jgi:uncharacterized membrane protein (DUF485 family)